MPGAVGVQFPAFLLDHGVPGVVGSVGDVGVALGNSFQRSVNTLSGNPRALVSSIFFSSGLGIARRRFMVSRSIHPFSQDGKIAFVTG
jgi:hypothetical protein